MIVIGICGGSGSGKGAACAHFAALGIPSIDTDAVYHDVTSYLSPCVLELAREFGDGVVKDGRLDRVALRKIVFSPSGDPRRQARLNAITHKYVIAETERILAEYEGRGAKGVIIDAPLLFESGLDARCDYVIAVIADKEVRLARIMLRDSIALDDARRRISAQMPDSLLAGRADIVIENNGSREELRVAVKRAYDQIFD